MAQKPHREVVLILIYKHLCCSIVGFYFHVIMTFLQYILDLKTTFYKTIQELIQSKNIIKLLSMDTVVKGECCVVNRMVNCGNVTSLPRTYIAGIDYKLINV